MTIQATAGDRVYQYEGEDGTAVFTDRRAPGIKPVAVKYYGRPTAVNSCDMKSAAAKARIKRYNIHVDKYATLYELEPQLVKAVIRAESCFNHKAVSRVGARGLMQLMPATAKSLGVRDSFDPEQNIKGGTKYLRMMLDTFDQDTSLALAAYNAGPNAVKKYDGIPPYKETQNYVSKIMRYLNTNKISLSVN